MKRSYLFLLLIFATIFCYGTEDSLEVKPNKPQKDDAVFKIGRVNIIKAAPDIHGIQIKGFALSYETGINVWPLSLNTTLRYFNGTDSTDGSLIIPRHFKVEIQPRFWGINYLNGIFLSPLLVVYHTGELAYGGFFGYQYFITDKLTAEAYIGMQTRSEIEDFDSPIFLRYGISFGFAFPKGVKSYGY